MDAAVSLHRHHGALPLPLQASLPAPPQHHRRALPLPQPRCAPPPPRSAPAAPRAHSVSSSSRAATGYAAALADACARAGTLRRAARHARALLLSGHHHPSSEGAPDARVAALVRMLAAKGKAGMVAEVMAEFAAICDHLLPPPPRAHAY
ncbi:hypothetical protein ACP4OV_013683 [Aristida adscensionis]